MPTAIHYFCSPKHVYTLGIFATFWARDIAAAIRIVPYNVMDYVPAFDPGLFIFTDFDRISSQNHVAIAALADNVEANGGKVLNHPRQWLKRLDLLHAWHAAGINDFTGYRLAQWREVKRFPVFIRHADGHSKPLTDLLPDRIALEKALTILDPEPPEGSDRIIVEMGNRRLPDGRYRKYSAFRVGGQDYASACQSSDHWWVKFSDDVSEKEKEEERIYIQDNPHRDQLDPVWRIAGAQYGRLDYCVVDGRVQAFEINSSPTIVYLPEPGRDHQIFADLHEAALTKVLAECADGQETRNPLFDPTRSPIATDALSRMVLAWGKDNWRRNWPQDAREASTVEPAR